MWTITHIIRLKSPRPCTLHSTIRTRRSGAFSSLTPTPERKRFYLSFAKSLALADKVILADIYAARETDTLGISSADLQALVQKEGKECFYFHTFEEIEDFVLKNCINGDLLITMGAGDVVNIGENLLSR